MTSVVLYRLVWVAARLLDRRASRPLGYVDDEGLWLAQTHEVHGAEHVKVTSAVDSGLALDDPRLRTAATALATRRLKRNRGQRDAGGSVSL